jgi:serine/threonine-protein phosphatase 2A regulatory subunit B''
MSSSPPSPAASETTNNTTNSKSITTTTTPPTTIKINSSSNLLLSSSSSWSTAKTNSLLFRWLSTPEAQYLLNTVCNDIIEGRPTAIPSPTEHTKALTQNSPQRLLRKNLAGLDLQQQQQHPTIIAAAAAAAAAAAHRFTTNHNNNNNSNASLGTTNTSSPSPSSSSDTLLTIQTSSSPLMKLDKIDFMTNPPPASPSSQRPKVLKKKSSAGSMVDFMKEQSQQQIPKFYEPGIGPLYRQDKADALDKRQGEISAIFANHPNGITVDDFGPICRDLLNFPLCFCESIFRRIRYLYGGPEVKTRNQAVDPFPNPSIPYNPGYQSQEEREEEEMLLQGTITEHDFCLWWRSEIEPFDRSERFFRLLKQPQQEFVHAHDFFPFVRSLVENHPGLAFLEGTVEFQEKYARTVVARIMAHTNTSWTGDITLRELRRSDVLDYFMLADKTEEINDVNEFFSYEHFYVIYCKFWELDQDHDFLITRDDLLRYSGHALTVGIVDRIFQQPAIPFTSRVPGKMGFEDFVWFILFEEDKTNARSVRYWFAHIDLDGDGRLCDWEIRQFYEEQLRRMQSLGHEEVTFRDMEVQLLDCLRGGRNGVDEVSVLGANWSLELQDFLNPQALPQCGLFFNLLFNLSKFAAAENRDPFTARQMAEDGLTDWDRFALTEYSRLAGLEEERAAARVEVEHHTNPTNNTTEISLTSIANNNNGNTSDISIRTDLSDSSEEWAESPSNQLRAQKSGSGNTSNNNNNRKVSSFRDDDEDDEEEDDDGNDAEQSDEDEEGEGGNSSEANTSEDGLDAHIGTVSTPIGGMSPIDYVPSRSASLSSMEDIVHSTSSSNIPKFPALKLDDIMNVVTNHNNNSSHYLLVVEYGKNNISEFWMRQITTTTAAAANSKSEKIMNNNNSEQ